MIGHKILGRRLRCTVNRVRVSAEEKTLPTYCVLYTVLCTRYVRTYKGHWGLWGKGQGSMKGGERSTVLPFGSTVLPLQTQSTRSSHLQRASQSTVVSMCPLLASSGNITTRSILVLFWFQIFRIMCPVIRNLPFKYGAHWKQQGITYLQYLGLSTNACRSCLKVTHQFSEVTDAIRTVWASQIVVSKEKFFSWTLSDIFFKTNLILAKYFHPYSGAPGIKSRSSLCH